MVIGFHHDAENEFPRHLNKVEALACRLRGTGRLSPGASIYRESKLTTYQALAGQGTLDFSRILGDAVEKIAIERFAAEQPAHRLVSRRVDFRDFRPSTVGLRDDLHLEPVGEREEIKHGHLADLGETVTKVTRARVYTLSRAAIVNDDISLVASIAAGAAEAALAAREDSFFGILGANGGSGPTMADGTTLFHASRANLLAAAALSAASLDLAIAALRSQTSAAGNPISPSPRWLLVGPESEGVARRLVRDLSLPEAAPIGVIASGHLAGEWYMFADSKNRPAFAQGDVGRVPFILESDGDFNTDGARFRLVTDFGIGAIDPRGVVKNPGV